MEVKIVLYSSQEGYAVSAPSLPGCRSQGTTREEAVPNITDAIQEYLGADADHL
jgi:predicted RNase H-like HicB family nuclease